MTGPPPSRAVAERRARSRRLVAILAGPALVTLGAAGPLACGLDAGGVQPGAADAARADARDPFPPADGGDGDTASPDDDATAERDGALPLAEAGLVPPCPTAPTGLTAWIHDGVGYGSEWSLVALTTHGAPQRRVLADGGTAVVFAGGEDAILFGTGSTVVEAPLALTVEGWIVTSTTTANARLADRTVPNKPETGWGFDILNGGVLRLFYGPLDASFHYVQSPAGVIAAATWHHVAGTVDGAPSGPNGTVVMKLYVDGVEKGQASFPDQRAIPASALALTLANSATASATPPLGLVGGLREIAVWKRALTPKEVLAVASGGAGARCGL
jgi:hypothetical protein